MTTHTRFYPNLRGQVTDQVEQAIQRLYEYVYSLQSLEDRVEAVRRIAEAAGKKADPSVVRRELQIGGRAPLNVSLLLGAAAAEAGLTAADIRKHAFWQLRDPNPTNANPALLDLRAVLRTANGVYLAGGTGDGTIGAGGTSGVVFRSTDGITWTQINTIGSLSGQTLNAVRGIAQSSLSVIALIDYDRRVFTSSDDGSTWTFKLQLSSLNNISRMRVFGTTWIAVSNGQSMFWTSTDDWGTSTERTPPNQILDVASDNTTYIFAGRAANNVVKTTDFVTFTTVSIATGGAVNTIAYSAPLTRWAIGQDTSIKFSNDTGATWTDAKFVAGSAQGDREMIWSGNEFLSVGDTTGDFEAIRYSKNGKYWGVDFNPSKGNFEGIYSNGTVFVAVGDNSLMMTRGL